MVKGNFSLLIHTNVFNIKIYSSSLMDKTNLDFCPASIESRLQKMMEPKPRQILAIILTVIIQFLIICCWTSYKYFILKSCTFIIHYCSFLSETNTLLDIYPSNRHIQICNISVAEMFGIQAFNILLVIFCTAYGYMTRHVRRFYPYSLIPFQCLYNFVTVTFKRQSI